MDVAISLILKTSLLGVLLLLLARWFYRRQKSTSSVSTLKRLPPGPRGLPLLGHILDLRPRVFLFLTSLRSYGPVVSFNLAMKPFIILNTLEAVKEAFSQEALSGRPRSTLSDSLSGNAGIMVQDGPVLKLHRRLTLRILRNFGMGRSLMEKAIQKEAKHLVQHLKSLGSHTAVGTTELFCLTTSNVICGVVFGNSPGYERDSETARLLEEIRVITQNASILELLPFFVLPITKRAVGLVKLLPKLRRILQSSDKLDEYAVRQIEEHREKLRQGEVSSSEPEDFLYAYLHEQEKHQSQGDSSFDDWKVIRVVYELFIAGTDTTATALTWMTLMLALHDDIRQKATEEIHRVVGRERRICVEDKKMLPYLQALTDEVLRYGCVAPTGGILHRALEDTEVLGYFVPKNTFIVTDLYGLFRDPALWKHAPDTFNPDNFLDEEGQYQPNENLIPFQLGKRSCIGEGLARMELFLFVGTLVQNFRFEMLKTTEDDLKDILLGSEGAIRAPGRHKIQFIPL